MVEVVVSGSDVKWLFEKVEEEMADAGFMLILELESIVVMVTGSDSGVVAMGSGGHVACGSEASIHTESVL